jgi:hypothetical protein
MAFPSYFVALEKERRARCTSTKHYSDIFADHTTYECCNSDEDKSMSVFNLLIQLCAPVAKLVLLSASARTRRVSVHFGKDDRFASSDLELTKHYAGAG